MIDTKAYDVTDDGGYRCPQPSGVFFASRALMREKLLIMRGRWTLRSKQTIIQWFSTSDANASHLEARHLASRPLVV